MIGINKLNMHGGTQPRDKINDQVVHEYATAMRDGEQFPPVTVFYDGSTYWLADGFHRVAAVKQLCGAEIKADIHQGTRRDAILFSASANAKHGLQRTNADKRRVILRLLRDAEWAKWSNREIARQCKVDEKTVRNVRAEAEAENPKIAEIIERIARRGQSTYTYIYHAPEPPISEKEHQQREAEALAAIHMPFLLENAYSADIPEDTWEQQPTAFAARQRSSPATAEDREKISAWIALLIELLARESDGSDYGELNGRFCNIRQRLDRHGLQFTDFISAPDLYALRDALTERSRRADERHRAQREQRIKATAAAVVAAASPVEQNAHLIESIRQASVTADDMLSDFAARGWVAPKQPDVSLDDLLDLFFTVGVQVATHPDCAANELRIRETCEQVIEIAFSESLAGVA